MEPLADVAKVPAEPIISGAKDCAQLPAGNKMAVKAREKISFFITVIIVFTDWLVHSVKINHRFRSGECTQNPILRSAGHPLDANNEP